MRLAPINNDTSSNYLVVEILQQLFGQFLAAHFWERRHVDLVCVGEDRYGESWARRRRQNGVNAFERVPPDQNSGRRARQRRELQGSTAAHLVQNLKKTHMKYFFNAKHFSYISCPLGGKHFHEGGWAQVADGRRRRRFHIGHDSPCRPQPRDRTLDSWWQRHYHRCHLWAETRMRLGTQRVRTQIYRHQDLQNTTILIFNVKQIII